MQTALDLKHHLILAHDVTNVGHDRSQLTKMASRAKEVINQPGITVLADRGYYNSEEILATEQAGIVPLVPKPQTSNNKAQGLYDKRDLVYVEQDDEYRCPAGQRAIYRLTRVEGGLTVRRYWSSACPTCTQKSSCTTVRIDSSHAGNTKQCSTECRRAWTNGPTLLGNADRPSNIRLERRKHGWVPHIS